MQTLNETIALMESENYVDRFKAEYYQLKIRVKKLHEMLVKYEAGTLGFELKSNPMMLRRQETMMNQYIQILEVRAQQEGIEL